jgi:hypothetical protein
LPDAW